MDSSHYTESPKQEIEERVKKAHVALKELQLVPSAVVQSVNMGNDTFAQQVICYLKDVRYVINKNDLDTTAAA